MAKKKKSRRPTIGFMAGNFDYDNADLWLGANHAVQEQEANLIYFRGNQLNVPERESENAAYLLADTDLLDGLVVWSAMIGQRTGPDAVRALFGKYRHLPMVSIGLALEGIPSLLVDNYQGMHDAVAHLIETHDLSRIAYVTGPEASPELQARYRGYVDALAEHGIPIDDTLIVHEQRRVELNDAGIAEYWQSSAHILLDERGLRPGEDLEAVAGFCDRAVLELLSPFQARGVHVPRDVALVGLDDALETRFVTPPMTTVRQSLYVLARRAVELLFEQMAGAQLPPQTILPMELIVRQSCGCPSPAVMQAAAESTAVPGVTLEATLSTQREDLLAGITQAVGVSAAGTEPGWAGQLLEAFAAEATGKSPELFLSTLEEMLSQVVKLEGSATAWQGAISALRGQLLPYLDGEAASRAENLWQQARVLVAETTQKARAYQAVQVEQQTQTLHEVGATLVTTFDVEELMNVLAEGLPRLGLPSAYLSLYERGPEPAAGDPHSPPKWSRLTLAYDDEGRIKLGPEGVRFPSGQLAPEGKHPLEKADRARSFAVLPLCLLADQLGFVMLEVGSQQGAICEALLGQISSALQGALTLRAREEAEAALEQAYAEVEKQIQERTAELQREVAEREKAQKESLRLQQEVIDAQRRAIQELSTPIIPVLEGVIVMPLIGSVDSMRARDLTRTLLSGIRDHRARVVILDITGVPIVDSGVASHLNKTVQAARLKGARTIVTGISDAVAETIVDQGIDWSAVDTLADLQTGLRAALRRPTASRA